MALALYRRYRPATFAEVVGQEHVTEPLRTALAAGRVNHAYLFSGPRGCGKTSSARIMARSLNCVQGPTPDPCGVCDSCVALAPNGPGSLDVTEMDAASHNGVDDARELRDRAYYAPASSRYRVFIIDEAHMITTQGFNALLKIVEEPPDHLVFVFATTEAEKVLTTIRSRTHHYPFRLLPPGTLRALLEGVCADEGVRVEAAVYPLVVRAGGGAARDSLSVLDQLLAGAGDEGVTYARAVGLLGVTDVALLDDVVDALGAHDGPAVFGAVDRLVEAGHDPRRFASDLLQRLRDLILVQAVPDAGERGLVDAPGDELERMVDQAARLGPAALARHAELVHTALTEMRGATAPRLLLELVCARMLLPAASSADAAMIQRLEGVERRLALGTSAGGDHDETMSRYSRPSHRPTPDEPEGSAGSVGSAADTSSGPARASTDRRAPAAPAPENESAPADLRSAPAAAAEAPTVGPPTVGPPTAEPPAVGPPTAESPAATVVPSTGRPDAVVQAEAAGEPTPPAAPGSIDAVALRRVWPEVMNQVRERNKPTHALLQNATVSAVEGTAVTLVMPTPPLARQLSQPNRADHVAAALSAVLAGEWTIRAEAGDAAAGGGGASRGRAPSGGNGGARGPTSDSGSRAGGGPQRPDPPAKPNRSPPSGTASPDTASPGTASPGEAPTEHPPRSGPSGEPRRSRPSSPPDDVPPPPEPPVEEVTEEDMYAEAAADVGGGAIGRRDPEDAVMELLSEQLGARRVEGR